MTEINQLSLKDLYALKRAWKNGINVDIQVQYTREGIHLRNNENGKDLLFTYNKTFADITDDYMYDDYADYCFIRWTKSYGSGAKEAKFKMKKFHENKSGIFIVDGYPFKRDQLCFLDKEFLNLNNEDFEDFALEYVEKFIKYKEDGERDNPYPKPWTVPGFGNLSEVEQEMLQKTKIKTKKEGNEMTNKITNIANTTVQVNKDAVKLAAKLEVGKIATAQMKKVVKPKLPMMVRGYADSPLFDIVLANAVGIALREYAQGNEKAQIVSEAMIQSAAVELVSSFNINDMVNEMLENIDVSKLMDTPATEA